MSDEQKIAEHFVSLTITFKGSSIRNSSRFDPAVEDILDAGLRGMVHLLNVIETWRERSDTLPDFSAEAANVLAFAKGEKS